MRGPNAEGPMLACTGEHTEGVAISLNAISNGLGLDFPPIPASRPLVNLWVLPPARPMVYISVRSGVLIYAATLAISHPIPLADGGRADAQVVLISSVGGSLTFT